MSLHANPSRLIYTWCIRYEGSGCGFHFKKSKFKIICLDLRAVVRDLWLIYYYFYCLILLFSLFTTLCCFTFRVGFCLFLRNILLSLLKVSAMECFDLSCFVSHHNAHLLYTPHALYTLLSNTSSIFKLDHWWCGEWDVKINTQDTFNLFVFYCSLRYGLFIYVYRLVKYILLLLLVCFDSTLHI